jgi:hypothetical protein
MSAWATLSILDAVERGIKEIRDRKAPRPGTALMNIMPRAVLRIKEESWNIGLNIGTTRRESIADHDGRWGRGMRLL